MFIPVSKPQHGLAMSLVADPPARIKNKTFTPVKSRALMGRAQQKETLPCWASPFFLHLPRPPLVLQKGAGCHTLLQGFRRKKNELEENLKKGQISRSKPRGRMALTDPRHTCCPGKRLSLMAKHIKVAGLTTPRCPFGADFLLNLRQ